MTEAELLKTAERLGNDAVRGLDAERVSQRVLARLATEPIVAVTPIRRSWVYGLAGLAAAAILVFALRVVPGGPTSPTTPTPLTVLHELDDLNVSELQAVLESLPVEAGAPTHPEPASLNDLDSQSLERLLRSLEG
jgi:hypothetical protein